jgi:hypothetical protein
MLIVKKFSSYKKPFILSDKSGIVIELSAILRKTLASWVKTFADFAKFLHDEIMNLASNFNRCDVITDRYFRGSLKEGIRRYRGSGTVHLFNDNTNLPSNFDSDFLSNSQNIFMKARQEIYASHTRTLSCQMIVTFCQKKQ